MRRGLPWLIACVLIGFGLLDWWYLRHKENRFDRHILKAAERYRVNPAVVKAVVWRESKFDPRVRGRAGEIGLMQIRSLAALEWAQAETQQSVFKGDLEDPETNLRVGTWYLGKLLKRYARTDNALPYALADYNAGRTHVLRWNKGAALTNSAAFVGQITFPGTREYIHAVMNRSHKYEGLTRGRVSLTSR